MRTCYECCCAETSDNPIIEVEDDHGNVVEAMCLECYTEKINADSYPDDLC